MGSPKHLRNSGIQLVLVLCVGLTLKSMYDDITNLRTKTELKRYLRKLNMNSYINRKEIQWKNPTGTLPCERQNQKVHTRPEHEVESVAPIDAISKLRYGGFYKPRDCVSRERTAIIIPYRDRADHLDILLNYLHKFLQNQQIQYGIFVVEMALPTQFNRGLLANVGFLTAHSIGNYTCYVIHDVDLLPTNDDNVYGCGNGPRHLITNCTKYEHGLPYKTYVGGVLAMTSAHFMAVNGYSNLYFGWGGEDDDMSRRINASELVLERPKYAIGTYTNLNHTGDSSNPRNPHKTMLLRTAEQRQFRDGLTSIMFQRQALEFRQKYTWILVKADEMEIMAEYPLLKAKFDLTKELNSYKKVAYRRTNTGVKSGMSPEMKGSRVVQIIQKSKQMKPGRADAPKKSPSDGNVKMVNPSLKKHVI